MHGCRSLMQVSWNRECSGNIDVRICSSSYKNRKPPALSAHILLRLHRRKNPTKKKSMWINQYHLYPSISERLGSSNISSRCFLHSHLLSRTEKLVSHICKILISQTQGKERGRHDSLQGGGKCTPWGTNATTLQGQGSPTGLGRNIYIHIGCYFLLGCVYSNAKINLHYTGTA